MAESTTPTTVYFNSACPVCRAGIEGQQARMPSCEVRWVDVHRDPASVEALGASLEDVRERLHVLDAQGRLQVGADALASLWSRTPGQRWAGRLVRSRWLRPLVGWAYDQFARWLYRRNRRLGRW